MVSSPPKSPLPGLQPHIVPVFRGKITEPPICPHDACSSPSPLSATSPTFPTARSKRRQTRSAPGQLPRGLLVVFLAHMRLECFQGKEPSGRSQWTVVVSRTDLLGPFRHEQTHFRPLLPDMRSPVHIPFYQPSTRAPFCTRTCSPLSPSSPVS